VSVELLLDNSAWVRLAVPALEDARAHEIADALEQRRIGVCLPSLLEAGLARAGHHRPPLVDLILAALADRHRVGVLHYDRDYDIVTASPTQYFWRIVGALRAWGSALVELGLSPRRNPLDPPETRDRRYGAGTMRM
jgi:hypothetical protein